MTASHSEPDGNASGASKDAPVAPIWPDPELPHSEQPGLVLAALTMLGEARGASTAGKNGVLWTIRNRRKIAEDYA